MSSQAINVECLAMEWEAQEYEERLPSAALHCIFLHAGNPCLSRVGIRASWKRP